MFARLTAHWSEMLRKLHTDAMTVRHEDWISHVFYRNASGLECLGAMLDEIKTSRSLKYAPDIRKVAENFADHAWSLESSGKVDFPDAIALIDNVVALFPREQREEAFNATVINPLFRRHAENRLTLPALAQKLASSFRLAGYAVFEDDRLAFMSVRQDSPGLLVMKTETEADGTPLVHDGVFLQSLSGAINRLGQSGLTSDETEGAAAFLASFRPAGKKFTPPPCLSPACRP